MINKRLFIISLLLFILDILSKVFIINNFKYNDNVVIIKDFFDINYVRNEGGAFSILDGNIIFIVVLTIIIIYFLYKYLKNKKLNVYELWGYGLIVGGAFGNLFDRVIYGYVVDFLDFYIFGYDFPVFNIADCGIVIGVFILMISEVRYNNGDKGRREVKN